MTRSPLALSLLSALLVPALAACDDGGSSAPGSAIVSWSLPGVATCDTLHIDTVEARAVSSLGDFEPVVAESIPCPSEARSGSITLADVPAGRYFIEVEGFNEERRGTHAGATDSKIRIPEGGVIDLKADQGTEIQLTEKPTDLIVDWDVGGKCTTAGVDQVRVTVLRGKDGTPFSAIEPLTAPCNNEFEHPKTGAMVAGVLFEAVKVDERAMVLVEGLDADGTAIMEGQSDPFDLLAGDVFSVLVELEVVQ